jgi:hypothetical protein
VTSGALSIFTPRAATLVLRSVSDPSRETTARRGDQLEIISQLGRGFAEVEFLGQRWFAAESGLEPWSAGTAAPPPSPPYAAPPQGYAANSPQAYPQSAPPPSPGPPPGGGWQAGYMARPPIPLLPLFIAVFSVIVVLGSFGTWAKVFGIGVAGTEGQGRITLVLGLVAAVSAAVVVIQPMYRHWLVGLALAMLLGAAALGIYNVIDLSRAMSDINSSYEGVQLNFVDVGWGLVAVTGGAIIGVVLCVIQLIKGSAQRPAPVMRW